jgi:hypothetical protein
MSIVQIADILKDAIESILDGLNGLYNSRKRWYEWLDLGIQDGWYGGVSLAGQNSLLIFRESRKQCHIVRVAGVKT